MTRKSKEKRGESGNDVNKGSANRENKVEEIKAVLAEITDNEENDISCHKLARALDTILAGVRDKSLADDLDLSYDHEVEVLLVLEEIG